MPQRRYKFLRQRSSIPAHVQSICRNQRKCVQKIREGQLVPDHLRRYPRLVTRIYDDIERRVSRYRRALYPQPNALFRCLSKLDRAIWVRI